MTYSIPAGRLCQFLFPVFGSMVVHYDLYERDAGRLLPLFSLFPQLAGNSKRREQSLECKRSLVETSLVLKFSFSVEKIKHYIATRLRTVHTLLKTMSF